ncbi:MAG: hypothetical protein NTZ61_04840, partial [Proteobacteria bacterium]|nr:hypothetical protein [Pseudomonadota bacterium]
MSGDDRHGRIAGNGAPPKTPLFEAALGSNPFVDALAGEVDPLDAWLVALDRLAAGGEGVVPTRPVAAASRTMAATPAPHPSPI